MSAVIDPSNGSRSETEPAERGSDRLNLLETIVVFSISCAVIIFVFAISAAGLGNYRFHLPDFLTDSVKTVWSLATAGGVAIAGSALDLALRRHPRRVNYPIYILATTGVLFIPIVGLLWFGKENQKVALTAPPGATVLDVTVSSFSKRSFSLSPPPLAPAEVGIFLNGEISLENDKLAGTASGYVARSPFKMQPAPQPTAATKVSMHLCSYMQQAGAPPFVGFTPPSPQANNIGKIKVPIPMKVDQVAVSSFNFEIDISSVTNREVVWLCATLFNDANLWIAVAH